MTMTTWAEGMTLRTAGTVGPPAVLALTTCNCCPQHLFWRRKEDCHG